VQVGSDIGDPAVVIGDVMMGSRSIAVVVVVAGGGGDNVITDVATSAHPWLDP
jgi:hypothetical protein